ncbi:MAG: branched-chain amino acid transport system ATP-binding protein [Chloroflexota bacterium]|nr:branched-chain amino acid transport system ATP-binding protein [Chloroflexota bacterium]
MLTAGMALMSSPKLLLVDELSLGLAPKIVEQLFAVLRQVNQDLGMAILLVEQFVPLALANTQRGYVLAKGEVAMTKPSSELKEDSELVASYLGGTVGEQEPAELLKGLAAGKDEIATRERGIANASAGT